MDIKSRTYICWDGFKGDLKDHITEVIKEHGEPSEIAYEQSEGAMACVMYPDKIFVTGWDGEEYTHCFKFDRTKANANP